MQSVLDPCWQSILMEKISQASSWVVAILLVGMLIMAYVAGNQKDEKHALSEQMTKKQGEVERYKKLVQEHDVNDWQLTRKLRDKDAQLSQANTILDNIQQEMDTLKIVVSQKQQVQKDIRAELTNKALALDLANEQLIEKIAKIAILNAALEDGNRLLGVERVQVKFNAVQLMQRLNDKQDAVDRLTQLLQASKTKNGQIVQTQKIAPQNSDSAMQQPLVITAESGASLRETNDTKGRRVMILPFGTKVKSLGSVDGWQKIKIEGFVFGELAMTEIAFTEQK